MADCATRLTEAKNALHALQIGESIVSVTMSDGRNSTYKPATINKLRTYIQELEAECGANVAQNRRGCIRFYG